MGCNSGKCGVLDRSLSILVEGLERRVGELDRQLAIAASAFRAIQDQQQVIRELLEAIADRGGEG